MDQTIQISRWRQKYACWLIVIFITLQCLIPLRHHLYPGNVNWTEEGQRFSWRMMLRRKSASSTFYVKTDSLSTATKVEFENYLTPRQMKIMAFRPDMSIQFAHFLVEHYQKMGHTNIVIHVRSQAKLNDRPWQTFIDPKVDLAALPRDLKHCDWIVPLESRDK